MVGVALEERCLVDERLPDQFFTFFWDYLDRKPVYWQVKNLVISSTWGG
jgi:hypothetical protein